MVPLLDPSCPSTQFLRYLSYFQHMQLLPMWVIVVSALLEHAAAHNGQRMEREIAATALHYYQLTKRP